MTRYRHQPFGHSKSGNIKRRNTEEQNKKEEPSFKERLMSKSKSKWMQHATKNPGKTRMYLMNKYGSKAFNWDGTINMYYLESAIDSAKRIGNTAWEKRLVLARTYKKDGGR